MISCLHTDRLNTHFTVRLLPTVDKEHEVQGGSNMTGTDLYVNKSHCAAAVRP